MLSKKEKSELENLAQLEADRIHNPAKEPLFSLAASPSPSPGTLTLRLPGGR